MFWLTFYLSINSFVPTRTAPNGAPKPLDKHILTESKPLTNAAGGKLVATAALKSLAPSQ